MRFALARSFVAPLELTIPVPRVPTTAKGSWVDHEVPLRRRVAVREDRREARRKG